jgi:outer membrane receptor protein involved in Fe transport
MRTVNAHPQEGSMRFGVKVRLRVIHVLLAGVLLNAGALPAFATENHRFNVAAQDAPNAIRDFAAQAHVQILVAGENVKDKQLHAVSGEFSTDQGLRLLLAGSGLAPRYIGNHSIALVTTDALRQEPTQVEQRKEAVQKKSFWDRFRVARVDEGSSQKSAATVESRSDSAHQNANDALLEEIVVTGSHLRTSIAKSASPVTVITQEEIKKRGLNSVEDIIRSLPQNFSTINAAASLDNSFNPPDARGQSAADLRGLGPENTLILVNGRRRAASITFKNGVVNLNTIPAGAIERVEVITDGASAIYGSDAVAGVINFILKKNYEGGETRARQESGANGGDAFSADQLLGMNWATGNVTASMRYTKNDSVDSRKAGLTTLDFRSLGGADQRISLIGQPGVTGFGSLPANDDGTHGIAGKFSPANNNPYDSAAYSNFVTTEGNNLSFNVNVEQRVGTHVSLYADLSYANNKSDTLGGIPIEAFISVPTTNRFNDTGDTVNGVGYAFINEFLDGLIPDPRFTSNQKARSGTLGAKFDLPFADWTVDVSGGLSREEAFMSAGGIDEELFAARVAGGTTSFVDGVPVFTPLPPEQHLNLFGNGTAQNPAALAGLVTPDGTIAPDASTSKLSSGLLSAEGRVIRLPGGEMRLAIGGEVRHEEFDYSEQRGSEYLTNQPKRHVQAAFAELSIPVFGTDNRVPGIYSLDLFAAARNEEYEVSGPFDGPDNPDRDATFRRTSPKFGVSWYVVPEVKLRATVSDSFRAPQLTDLFSQVFGPYPFVSLFDPQHPEEGTLVRNTYIKGNPALGPETSHNFTAGIDWKPTDVLQGLAVSATYDRINMTNRIASVSNLSRDQPQLLFDIPGVVERDASGHISAVNLMSVNLAARKSTAVDLTATYDFATANAGDILLGFAGTYAIKMDDTPTPGADPIEIAGTETGPEKRKWRTWVSWSTGNYGATATMNYSSGYTNVHDALGTPHPVDSYTTYDLTAFYRLDRLGLSVDAGVRNLTNTKFPFFDGFGTPWDPRRVDPRGRIMYIEIAKKYGLPGAR